MDITKDPYYRQLKEIQKYGVVGIGYFDNIFKDDNFDITYLFRIINNEIIPNGVYAPMEPKVQHVALNEYIFDNLDEDGEITEETLDYFKPLAKYFFNYNKYIKED